MNRRALALLSVGHFLIDLCQGVVPALVPFLVEGRGFSKAAAAGLVFAISATSSVVQPLFGQLADRLAMAWLLPASILLAGAALALGAQATSYAVVLLAFGLSGLGVAAFHPEAARKANLASGDRRTTGMSIFSIGGGIGFALAPAVTLALVAAPGHLGPAGAALIPTAIIAGLLPGRFGLGCRRPAAPLAADATAGGEPSSNGHDDWRAFGILSGATVLALDRLLRPQHVPGALLHEPMAPDGRRGEPGDGRVPGHQHRRHAAGRLDGRPLRPSRR